MARASRAGEMTKGTQCITMASGEWERRYKTTHYVCVNNQSDG
jgi:hypothetical protein